MIQEAYPLQQKVFKFHNVSKDVILGNKRVKKEIKGKSKKLPPDKLQHQIEESQEKMAEMILKQYIPIRQKVAPVVNSQTKKYKEAISLRKTKKLIRVKTFPTRWRQKQKFRGTSQPTTSNILNKFREAPRNQIS